MTCVEGYAKFPDEPMLRSTVAKRFPGGRFPRWNLLRAAESIHLDIVCHHWKCYITSKPQREGYLLCDHHADEYPNLLCICGACGLIKDTQYDVCGLCYDAGIRSP